MIQALTVFVFELLESKINSYFLYTSILGVLGVYAAYTAYFFDFKGSLIVAPFDDNEKKFNKDKQKNISSNTISTFN